MNRLAVSMIGVSAALGVAVGLAVETTPAQAVPSFAQQTGQPCSACHVGAFGPQLKPYGRDFKLNGYEATDNKSQEPPIAATWLSSFTHTQQGQSPSAAPHFGANDNFALDQASVYYAGRAPAGLGVFAQVTYVGVAEQFNIDNVDIRKARTFEPGGEDLTVGIDINNNPTVQDLWNSTPAWSFPYTSSPLGPHPGASALIDGGLAHLALGAGAYAFWDYALYAEFNAYEPLDPVFAGRIGEGTNSASDRFAGEIPYWRLALNHDFSALQSAQVGGYGLTAQRYPGTGKSFGADRLTDWAIDANYVNAGLPDKQTVSAHVTWIHEDQNLKATALFSGANLHDTLDTLRGDLSWSFADTWTPTVQLFRTTGSADPALYPATGGRPTASGSIVELAYTGGGKPVSTINWANWRAAMQYVAYTQFNGVQRGASANNTLYFNVWLAVAPLGFLVKR